MDFNDLLQRGVKFNSWGPALTMEDISALESMVNAPLPPDYSAYLLYANGGTFERNLTENDDGYFAVVEWPNLEADCEEEQFDEQEVSFANFFLYDASLQDGDDNFRETLAFEYFNRKDALPLFTMPIGHDPEGNDFLLGLGKENRGQVTYWDPDEPGDSGYVADSFAEFILSMHPASEWDEFDG